MPRRFFALTGRFGQGGLLALALLGTAHTAVGGEVKSLQSGTVTLSGGLPLVVLLPTAVDPARALLVFGTSENSVNPADGQVSGQISGPTSVTFQRVGGAGSIALKYYVVEFSSGASVQRGSTDVAAGTVFDVALPTAVDTAKSFPIVSLRSAGTNFNCDDFVRARLTSSTNLRLWTDNATCGPVATAVVEWQVVQYEDATVRSGDLAFAATDASRTAALAPAVNTAKSWLIYSYDSNQDSGAMGQYLVRGQLTNSTTLTFDRSASGAVGLNLTWYLVEFTDATTVQRGSQSFLTADTVANVALPQAVPLATSIAVGGGDYERGGRSSYVANDVAGVGWFNFDLTSATGLRITRGAGGLGPADVGWFVVSFPSCCSLSTVEGAGTLTVTAANQFEMVFSTAAGGSIEQLYDLLEDPGRTLDLAGSVASSANPRGLHNFGLQVGVGNFYNAGANDQEARLQLLEATSARVRVRQDAFYQNGPGGPRLGGVKGYGDYSVYPIGRVGLHWDRRVTAPAGIAYDSEYKEIFVHRLAAGPLSGWLTYNDAGPIPPAGSGGSDFVLAQNDTAGSPGARTDVLDILYRDWTTANGYVVDANQTSATTLAAAERTNVYWNQPTGPALPDGRRDTWNSLTYIKPTTLTSNADAAVTARSADYRSPATPGILVGTSWQDPDENTGSDNFNEAEAAYLFSLDPAAGLRFTLNGAAQRRFAPFFKIRYWRSLFPPVSITFDRDSGGPIAPVTLTRTFDYQADVKPVSRAPFADRLLWHSTLQDAAAVTSPDVGTGGAVGGTASPTTGRYGQGYLFDANNEEVTVATSGDFDANAGAVEFWVRPLWNHTDGAEHWFWGYEIDNSHQFWFRKLPSNALEAAIRNGSVAAATITTVPSTSYSWRPGDWVHLRVAWNKDAPVGEELRIFVNGVEPAHTDNGNDYNPLPAAWPATGRLWMGVNGTGQNPTTGVIDEFHVYSSPTAPGPGGATPDPSGRSGLAQGGLAANASEYLAVSSAGRDFTYAFAPVDAATTRRGQYAYFGSDSKFGGLNIALAVPGVSAGTPALQWQYWNGTSWVNLALTDETSGLRRNGSVYWAGDLFAWKAYSVNGGPDLYYVRSYLTAASPVYTTPPVEAIVKTDVLLFQYCADVATDNQLFVFAAPVPTAVGLMSFAARALDAAVDLSWQTASELDNLGFHLYRGLSESGPWERITASLIPGLGSSPVGAAYSWRDTGLENGTRYFYRLEDVDTASVSTFHGPVSAVPEAGLGESGGGSAAGSGEGGGGDETGTASSPALPACTSPPTSLPCVETYGDPASSSWRVVRQTGRYAEVELVTGGFEAIREAEGGVRLRIPGFEDAEDPHAPALPFKRVVLDAAVGRRARLAWAREREVERYRGLELQAAGFREMDVRGDGTVRAVRRRASLRLGSGRTFPMPLARLGAVWFVGESKEQALELFPVTWDAVRGVVRLSKRLRVRVEYGDRDPRERGRGWRGRKSPRPQPESGETLAVLHTTSRGLYGVGYESLLPGQSRALAVDALSLKRQGETVAFHVEPETGRFGPGSVLYFWSERGPKSTSYVGEVAYELSSESGGKVMARAVASPSGPLLTTPSLGRADYETNRIYQSGLLDAEDLWQWENLQGGVGTTKSFSLAGVDPASSRPGRLSVWLQGASDAPGVADHHVEVSLNGIFVGEVVFDGKVSRVFEAEVPASAFVEGTNELTVTNAGDTGVYSLVFLDRFRVAYPQASVVRAGAFEGQWAQSGTAEVATTTPVSAVDVTDPQDPVWLLGLESSPGLVSLRAEAGREYVLASPGAVMGPRVSSPVPTSLRDVTNQADYILIAPEAFLSAAQPLLQRRQSQGLRTRAASLEEIASAFGHGEASGEAIQAFLTWAYQEWRRPSPRYVLLLGDASHDPRNFMGSSGPAPLPALFLKTSYLVTVSDPVLAAVNGDDLLPDLAIGRLPAQTAEQARVLVQKVLDWEDSGQGLRGTAVLVADNPDAAGDFEADVLDIKARYLSRRSTRMIFLRQEGAGTRSQILAAMDSGASFVSYVGHGGAAVWASENVLNSWDAASLQAQSTQGVMLTLNCLNGYFVAPSFDSLAEAFLKAEGRGTVASVSPSGLSLDEPAHVLHRALMEQLVSGSHERLGDAVLAAQAEYARSGQMPELLEIYLLLGDPGMKIGD